jgi:hypothetical protein
MVRNRIGASLHSPEDRNSVFETLFVVFRILDDGKAINPAILSEKYTVIIESNALPELAAKIVISEAKELWSRYKEGGLLGCYAVWIL